MYAAAPLIDARLRRSISRRARRREPIAETWRQICAEAARFSLPRPSYEQVRVYVHRARHLQAATRTVIVLVRARRPPAARRPRPFAHHARRILHHLRR